MTPTQVLQRVLDRVHRANWQERDRLQNDLAPFLTDDLFMGDYELAATPPQPVLSAEVAVGYEVEILVRGGGLPDKATLAFCDGTWKLKAYRGQCTGCLGSGEILGRLCDSCSGTGWGLRPRLRPPSDRVHLYR
jgi:hypothetical protein